MELKTLKIFKNVKTVTEIKKVKDVFTSTIVRETVITEDESDRLGLHSDTVLCNQRVAAEAVGVSLSLEKLNFKYVVRTIL